MRTQPSKAADPNATPDGHVTSIPKAARSPLILPSAGLAPAGVAQHEVDRDGRRPQWSLP
ncbi:hypothetical protein [Kitasatospora brasiliensis]|uniref:hypothetical protein n=1 Tax=Kitasatospora brasiliensis TaxID=3058040 RepID=UPI00292DF820|nr:hypothetical protein [Kitasatospora sp. K002]